MADPKNRSRSGSTSTGSSTSTSTSAATRRPKAGPALNWTPDRDLALAEIVASGDLSASSIARKLSDHDAFEGERARVTGIKVKTRVAKLRKAGAPFPELTRGGASTPDVDRLRAVLTGGSVSATPTTSASASRPTGEDTDD